MIIRQATLDDYLPIKILLQELDFPGTDDFLLQKIFKVLNQPNSDIYVYESEGRMLAFMTIDYISQIALAGDLARLTYFSGRGNYSYYKVAADLEKFCVALARQKNCIRIELNSHQSKEASEQFCFEHGYQESPQYLVKAL